MTDKNSGDIPNYFHDDALKDLLLVSRVLPSREIDLEARKLSLKVVVNEFGQKVNESYKDEKVVVGAIENKVDENVMVFNRLSSNKNCESSPKMPTQRHLFGVKSSSKKLTNGRSPSKNILESKKSVVLKTKIRPKSVKMNAETPEKSEILRMFEKIVKNRGGGDATDVEKCQDKLSGTNTDNATFSEKISFISVENGDFGLNALKNTDFNEISNPRIGRKSANSNLSSTYISSEFKVADKNKVDGSIVRTPNSTLRISQSDQRKKSKPPRSVRKTVKELKEEIESRSMKPITSFFQKKTEKTLEKDSFGESSSSKISKK